MKCEKCGEEKKDVKSKKIDSWTDEFYLCNDCDGWLFSYIMNEVLEYVNINDEKDEIKHKDIPINRCYLCPKETDELKDCEGKELCFECYELEQYKFNYPLCGRCMTKRESRETMGGKGCIWICVDCIKLK